MDDCECILKHFHKVTYEDIALIEKYLKLMDYEESNHNIVNIMIWLDLYPLYEIHDEDFMILIGTYHNEYFMYMPLCHKDKEAEVIRVGKQLMDSCHIPFTMSCFVKEYKDIVKDIYPDARIEDVRDGYDYVYELDKLRGFKGKKLQKKRNHLNNFYKLYGDRYLYEDIDSHNIHEVIEYMKEQDIEGESLQYERDGIIKILESYEKFSNITGGLIRIDGHVESYIIASRLSDRMIQENVEKSNKDITGLPQAMINEFFKRHYLEYPYLNREDDMGIDNLRISKLSYNPVFMIDKYYINV